MSSQRLHTQGVMEGRGAYNQHAHLQNSGNLMLVPLIEQLLADNALTPAGSPIFLAGSMKFLRRFQPMMRHRP